MKQIEIGWGEVTLGGLIRLAQVYNTTARFDGDRHVVVLEVEE